MLAAADEVHNLHRIPVADDDVREGMAFDNGEIVFDGDPARINLEPCQQVDDGQRLIDLVGFAVQRDEHFSFDGSVSMAVFLEPVDGAAHHRSQPNARLLDKSR